MSAPLDALDRALVERLQEGVAVAERPFAPLARELGVGEDELLARIARLLEAGVLTRFGPMFQIERMGGAFSLCALAVPRHDFERVARVVNALPEVAHNYERDHDYNMWFVLAAERPEDIERAIARIERETGLAVLHLPKIREYFVGLRLAAAA
jgi:DNA-binding Lrp family transcriptional regulator